MIARESDFAEVASGGHGSDLVPSPRMVPLIEAGIHDKGRAVRRMADHEVDRLLVFRGIQSLPARPAHVPSWSVWLAVLTSATAILATAGGIALAAGVREVGATIDARFPAHNAVAAGAALIVVVAIPMTWATVSLYVVSPHAGATSTIAGALLLLWLSIEMVITEFSWLQVLFAADGALLMIGGMACRARRLSWTPTRQWS